MLAGQYLNHADPPTHAAMKPFVMASSPAPVASSRALRALLREEDAWLFRQIGNERPVVWLRPQPLGSGARHGVLALRVGAGGLLRGALRTDVRALPWADESLSAMVLQHVVEGASWSDALLAESARVLAPEGRLYILRFDRFSPWFWRHGRRAVRRGGGTQVTRPIDLRRAHGHGLSLEYRHSLGGRGFRAETASSPTVRHQPDQWPFANALKAARVWVMRKRRPQWLMTRVRDGSRQSTRGYGLAIVRRETHPGADP